MVYKQQNKLLKKQNDKLEEKIDLNRTKNL